VSVVFGIPGTQTLPLNQAIAGSSDIGYVMARHETAVSHQAWGYAQSSGDVAATLVVPGPGDMNAMNGLKNALNDCSPLLHIAIETDPEVRGGNSIHETPPDTYDNVVKENILVETPESVLAELDRALAIARSSPKGPVRLGIPRRFLSTNATQAAERSRMPADTPGDLPTERLEEAAELLEQAERPIIVAGGGVRVGNATQELRAFAERLSAPVVVTTKGKGVFPEDHSLFAGVFWGGSSQAVTDCLAESDTTLAVGSDLDGVTTSGWSTELPGLIHITLDADDLGGFHGGYSPVVSVVSEASQALSYLIEALPEQSRDSTRALEVRDAEEMLTEPLRSVTDPPLNSVAALDAIRDALPRDSIITADAGGSRLWTVATFDVYDSRNYVNPGSWASMGVGLPAAMGAKVANPEQPVVSLVGDGGVLMSIHELHTMVAEDIPVIVVVFNNADYAIISDVGASEFDLDEQTYSWTDAPIDFAAVAEGFGMRTAFAQTKSEIAEQVAAAVECDEPTLIEVPTDPLEPQTAAYMQEQTSQ
jgi:acetolactate synthase-1/2/3 large subunit